MIAPSWFASDEREQEALGGRLGACCEAGALIELRGDLGAGKTTLARGFLRARGHQGKVRSPTYTLVEPYDLATGRVYHFDLYRLTDPEELEFLGVRDLFDGEAIGLVEWPERGLGHLPNPDLQVVIVMEGLGRRATFTALTARGERMVACMAGSGRNG